MKYPGAFSAIALLLAAALAGCGDSDKNRTAQGGRNPTAVLGGYGNGPRSAAAHDETLTDSQGKPIAAPHDQAQLARTGPDTAVALWVQNGHVVAASYASATGWTAPQPLEEIYGEASDPRVVSNGKGIAMAVWRHTVGNIQSLRTSRFETAAGWAVPDVMPGALPRPRTEGSGAAPQLRMDANGNAYAEWPSGFALGETQNARYLPGQGWTRALSEPVATASPAATAGPPASSVQ